MLVFRPVVVIGLISDSQYGKMLSFEQMLRPVSGIDRKINSYTLTQIA